MRRTLKKRKMRKSASEVLTDMDIVRKVLDGDTESFSCLLNRYQSHVLKIVKKHIPRERIEETAQEAFVRVYQSLKNFRKAGSFKKWVAAITVRTCYDYWRQYYRRKEIPMSLLSVEQNERLERTLSLEAEEDREALGRRREAKQLLDSALYHLSAEDRMVVELIHLEGFSVKEAAELLGWSSANIKVRAFRSRQKLQKILTNLGRE